MLARPHCRWSQQEIKYWLWYAGHCLFARLGERSTAPGSPAARSRRGCCSCVLLRSRRDFVRRGSLTWPDTLVSLSPFGGKPSEPAQCFGHLQAPADTGDHHVDHGKGRVEVAATVKLLDRHTGGSQGFGVSDTLVAQRIELAGDHQRLRQALEFAAQWRDARIGSVCGRTVQVPEPVHQRARQEVARRIVIVGRAVERAVGDRAYQKLA